MDSGFIDSSGRPGTPDRSGKRGKDNIRTRRRHSRRLLVALGAAKNADARLGYEMVLKVASIYTGTCTYIVVYFCATRRFQTILKLILRAGEVVEGQQEVAFAAQVADSDKLLDDGTLSGIVVYLLSIC